MKALLLLFCLALASCTQPQRLNGEGEPFQIDPTKPPSGVDMVQILLENQSLPLKGTNCEDKVRSPDNRRLLHKLATNLGEELNNPQHHTELQGGDCEAVQHDLPSGKIVDAWRCRFIVTVKGKEEDFGASIHFSVTKDTWKLVRVPEALLCL